MLLHWEGDIPDATAVAQEGAVHSPHQWSLILEAGQEPRLSEERRYFSATSLAAPGRKDDRRNVSGKRHFAYFAAEGKVSRARGRLPRIK